jgi:hypothetical protein
MPTTTNIQRTAGDDLATALSAYTFAGTIDSIEAVWRRVPDYDVEALGTLQVSVTPGPYEVNQAQEAPRGSDFFEPTLGIVVAKSVTNEQEISDLEELVQGVVDAIRSYHITLTSFESSSDWREITVPVPFDRDMLAERNVFLAQISVTWMIGVDKVQPPQAP